jgi:uncharacterized protein YjbI with pentapeptide repeats
MYTKAQVQLIRQLCSLDNKLVLQAVEELRVRGWLNDGTLRGIALCQAQLQGADLTQANLSSVDFHQARLERADLSQANLRGAKLVRANLQGANLSHASLAGADLYKADLRRACNLTDEQLSQVTRLWGAIMLDGESYDGRYNLPGDFALAQWGQVDVNDPQAMADFFGVSLETYLRGQGQEIELSV